MFARLKRSRGDPGDDDTPARRLPTEGKRGVRIPLPSPLMLGLFCLLVVLPLAWPEADIPPSGSFELASFNLAADVAATAFSADGRHLAAACRDRPVACWEHGESSWKGFALPFHRPNGARAIALSPADDTLATGNVDGTISIWDLKTGTNRATIPAGSEMIVTLSFSPDGAVLAVACADATLRLIDVAEGRVRNELSGHRGPITALAFYPDGHSLASGGDDGTILLWDVKNARQVGRLLGATEVVLSLAVSPGGTLLASSTLCDHRIRLWDLETLESRGHLATEASTSTSLIFPADGGPLISGDDQGDITLWDLAQARPRSSFRAHVGWIKSLSLGARSQALASGGNDGYLRVWDLVAISKAHGLQLGQ